jgi:hypothetical protein
MSSFNENVEYAWYSQNQFEHINNNTGYNNGKTSPYIYYKLTNGKTVQVTEIMNSVNKSNFDDAVCLGIIESFYCVRKIPIELSEINAL